VGAAASLATLRPPAPRRTVDQRRPALVEPVVVLPLDLACATPAELESLPRIGPALAARIVEDRRARGPFQRVDELTRVPGIGPGTLARIAPMLVVRPGEVACAGVSPPLEHRAPK
jgi:predicted DNA-binding helix-hairpin-helix protein